MSEKNTCPTCHGEGKVAFLVERTRQWTETEKMFLMAAVTVIAIVLGWIYYALNGKADMERCAVSCGDGRLKTWTEETPGWTERRPMGEVDVTHPPVPGKCECLEK